ncbi:MAG: hypothetical protein KDB88_14620, partial [Flavobacteriales bacterium]|nr:hypothetical protein [Flavobacteriales bacterium]
MKHGYALILFVFQAIAGSAQYTIPDPAFAAELQLIVPNAMTGNVLDETHPDVLALTTMLVGGANITDLDGLQFFVSLVELNCSQNELTQLPDLPPGLEELRCNGNDLTALPPLPATLSNLRCGSNQLTALPTLPPALSYLDCAQNQLGALPTLPNGLGSLYCGNNLLTSLPTLP